MPVQQSPAQILLAQTDLQTNASYAPGVVGSAVLRVMENGGNIRGSNYGAGSFQVENTGGKKISGIFIDVRGALYPDSVFDPDGAGGDNVTKPWGIDSAGGTGAFITGTGYFLPGPNPLPNTTGTGKASNGGYEGAMVKFNAGVSAGFQPGERVTFSGDMDPNSLAGLLKTGVDSGALLAWDAGGVSGHELIGSDFVVLFNDGTTATGSLMASNSVAGARAVATQNSPAEIAGLTVNGVGPGGSGLLWVHPAVRHRHGRSRRDRADHHDQGVQSGGQQRQRDRRSGAGAAGGRCLQGEQRLRQPDGGRGHRLERRLQCVGAFRL